MKTGTILDTFLNKNNRMKYLIGFVFVLLFGFLGFAQESPDVVLTTGHNDQINAMDVTPNGRFLASASNDKQIKIWDLSTGMEFRTISGTAGRVEQLAFSPDNVHLAGTSFNEELLVWNVISGEVIYSGKAGATRGLTFSKDGKRLYFVDENSNTAVFDMDTKGIKRLCDIYSTEFVVDKTNQKLYILDHLGNIHKVDMNSGATDHTTQLFDSFTVPFSNSDITQDGRYIATGYADDKLRIYDTEKKEFHYESKAFDSKLVSLAFDHSKPIVYVSLHSGDIVLFNYKTKKEVERTNLRNSPFRTQCLSAHPDGEIVLFANNDLITLFDFNKRKVFKQLERRVNRIFNMAYDPMGRYLAVATDKAQLKLWDLRLNKVVDSIPAFFPCEFTPDGKSIIAMTYQINLGLFDVESGKQVKTFNTDAELIQSVSVSPDGKKLAGAGYQNIVKVWDLETTDRIASMSGHMGGILSLDFHPEKPWVVSGSLDQTARVWDYSTKKELVKFEEQTVSVKSVKFSPDGTQLATAAWDKSIYLRKTGTWEIEHKLTGHVNIINTIDYSGDGTVLISGGGNNSVGDADNSVICWDTKTGDNLCQFKDHRGEILKVISDPQANRFFSASVDGAVKYSDYSTCELVATYQAIGSKEFMIFTPDNYYIASRNALSGIAFRIGDKLVPFEQFDIHLNRPDIVADRIGKSSPELIRAYHYLYKKRLKKLNLDEGSIQMDFNLPKVINETKYDIVTTEKAQKLWVKAWDDNYNLKQINVFVNNVPIFGQGGLPVPGNVKSYRTEIEIPLIADKNKILISVMNSNGVESLYESLEIVRNGDPEKHDLYIVAIGVSDYQDERFKLKYPTKDAQDILNKFKESESMYSQVHSKLLINQDVTVENIESLKTFFSGCTHEDFAVIFIAGHGVLNADYDYFYGTYDMDFDSPEGRGLPYTKISGLLDQIRAYRKLLIMDTCHSGELDKDEIEEGPAVEQEDGDVQFRGVGVGIRKKEGIGVENSIKISEDLFSDIRKGSGATVISSAGGAEYAMESDEWKNGLFTYVFLKGLTASATDKGVYLSEIRAYVNQEVYKLSEGKQIPSAREENISRDYIIFGN